MTAQGIRKNSYTIFCCGKMYQNADIKHGYKYTKGTLHLAVEQICQAYSVGILENRYCDI